MAQTVVIHRPGVPGSTMRVTAKAYRAAYASDGFVEGVQEGDRTPSLDHHHRADVARSDAQVAELQEQLRKVQAERDAIAAQHALPPTTAPAPAAASAAPPRTDNPPAKRAPRKRTRPNKAAAAPAQAPDPAALATQASTAPQPSPGPPDIGSTPALD